MSTPRVVVSFFPLILLHDWTNEREYYTSGSALFSSDYLLLLLYSLTFVYCCLSRIYSLLFISSFSLSLPSNFFAYILIGAFCFMNPRTMVMLIIMTFIYHIRSVMPFTQIYLYTNTSQPNRLNSIQDTSCVNKSWTDQFLFFVLSSHFSEVWFFYQADDLLLFEHDTFIVIRMIKVFFIYR